MIKPVNIVANDPEIYSHVLDIAYPDSSSTLDVKRRAKICMTYLVELQDKSVGPTVDIEAVEKSMSVLQNSHSANENDRSADTEETEEDEEEEDEDDNKEYEDEEQELACSKKTANGHRGKNKAPSAKSKSVKRAKPSANGEEEDALNEDSQALVRVHARAEPKKKKIVNKKKAADKVQSKTAGKKRPSPEPGDSAPTAKKVRKSASTKKPASSASRNRRLDGALLDAIVSAEGASVDDDDECLLEMDSTPAPPPPVRSADKVMKRAKTKPPGHGKPAKQNAADRSSVSKANSKRAQVPIATKNSSNPRRESTAPSSAGERDVLNSKPRLLAQKDIAAKAPTAAVFRIRTSERARSSPPTKRRT